MGGGEWAARQWLGQWWSSSLTCPDWDCTHRPAPSSSQGPADQDGCYHIIQRAARLDLLYIPRLHGSKCKSQRRRGGRDGWRGWGRLTRVCGARPACRDSFICWCWVCLALTSLVSRVRPAGPSLTGSHGPQSLPPPPPPHWFTVSARSTPSPHWHNPSPLKSSGRHGHFFNFDMRHLLTNMRQSFQKFGLIHVTGLVLKFDIRHGHIIIIAAETYHIGTLAFLKIDRRHGDPPPPRQEPHCPLTPARALSTFVLAAPSDLPAATSRAARPIQPPRDRPVDPLWAYIPAFRPSIKLHVNP